MLHTLKKPNKRDCVVVLADSDSGPQYESNRRSRTGALVEYGNEPIYATSKKQKTVASSSLEAEFKALAGCPTIVVWISRVKLKLGITQDTTVITQNNSAAIESAN